MVAVRGLVLLLQVLGAWQVALAASAPLLFNITIPESASDFGEEDAYICTTLPLPPQPMKLVGVEPLAEQEVVHHILLFGCSVPHVAPRGGDQPVWDCKRAPTCGSNEETILYGWGRNAPKLQLPEGVGFSVGGSSSIAYIVAQLHYLQPKPKGDTSGVSLSLQRDPVPFSAGLLSYASWFSIPPRKKEHLVVNACCYRGFQPLTTFAVRVHTHTMGRSVFMTRKWGNGTDGLDWLAKGDPLAPQGFNPVARRTIFPGDPLTVTCAFDSSGVDRVVSAGPTHDHEMCNMYLMVYSAIPHIEMCNDGEGIVSDAQPGSLPRGAALLPDPFPGWRPPLPTDKVPAGDAQGVLGDVTSVAMGPDGKLWALHRGGAVWDDATFDSGTNRLTAPRAVAADVVLQMDPDTGKVLRRWGAGHLFMPHMISVDPEGAVWVVDVGRHQVLKFSQDGRLLLEVGRRLEPGAGKQRLCKPTQVAFLRDGSFVVADGYCNSRAVRFARDGRYASEYGAAAGAMGVVHSVAVDECAGRLYLADREGRRAVTLDLGTGALLQSADLSRFGRVWALRPGPYGRVLALAWERSANATLVEVSQFDEAEPTTWLLPGTADLWPHDMALGAAPLALSGAGARLFAVHIAPLCAGCGPVAKYVFFPGGAAGGAALPPPPPAPKPARPVLAHFGGHASGAAAQAHGGERGGGGGGGAASSEGGPRAGARGAAGARLAAAEAQPELHETLRSRGAPRRGFWLSAAQVAGAAAVLAALVAALAFRLLQRQQGAARAAAAVRGGELARLAGGGWRGDGGGDDGGGGLFDGLECGGDVRDGGGGVRGGAGSHGGGGGGGGADDEDLERLEREMLLRDRGRD
ncbi:MAG: PHM/PNGase F domain-containing protein [Monoraphidium minutum]|nr:MAG: PHM/PNGase F domain-containing protein [Monoraphidium minutum]